MSTTFCSFAQIQRHLDALGLFHLDMGLERVRRALTALDLTRPPFVTVQVLGTNGKGSTSAFLASLARAHGCRVGLYTSPHFVSPTERVRISGPTEEARQSRTDEEQPEQLWVDAANAVMAVASDLTYFEFLTVLALWVFARRNVDLAVLEAGLGGRHDATTAVTADLLCFTPVALDHKDILGSTLAAIAADKGGAIRGRASLCFAPQFPEADAVLTAHARAHSAPLFRAAPVSAGTPLGLKGPHQRVNAGLALTAWQRLAPMLGRRADHCEAQARGLAQAFVPGRLQSVPGTEAHPPLLLDGAHNPHGMAALINALRAENIQPAGAVFSCLKDKDWPPAAKMLKAFLGAAPLLTPRLNNPRAAGAEHMTAVCNSRPPATARAIAEGPQAIAEALALARALPHVGPQRPLLLTGSLYLLAEFFSLHPQWLEPPQAAPSAKSAKTANNLDAPGRCSPHCAGQSSDPNSAPCPERTAHV